MVDEDIDDMIDELKKYFNIDSGVFDVDFIFIPEPDLNIEENPNLENSKGVKISYHFETGMKKPEIKIEGNIDNKKIWDYLNKMDLSKVPGLKEVYDHRSKTEIDAGNLTLDVHNPKKEKLNTSILEPYTENSGDDLSIEIVIEIPGMDKEDVAIILKDEGRIVMLTAENGYHRYMKTIPLPFKTSLENYKLEINNGIATIKVTKARV
ncbi:MAG TPA: hypothetical protein ENI29_22850 [bacterium]|nr:hypothetical protein [bacterium]